MSYSRWSNSCWYTFQADAIPTTLVVMPNFTAPDGYFTYEAARVCTKNEIIAHFNCTERQALELLGYIREFVKDVESEFSIFKKLLLFVKGLYGK
jgi:hypothetical protein